MYFLETRTTDPYDNLAAEERLMDTVPRGEGGLMLWQNDRTIVVGKYQNTAEEITAQYVEEHQIRVARRLSGGGAVYHDLGNLNYTIIEDQEGARKIDFAKYISPVIRTLEGFGISAEFTGRNDIVIDKLIMRSCKSAVKGGEHLSEMEIRGLIDELAGCSNPYCCPHGRPTFIRYTKYEIERSFRRK